MSNRAVLGWMAILIQTAVLSAEVLKLSEAYELALKNEPHLRALALKAAASEEGVEQSRSRLYPQLQGNVSWGRYEYDAIYLKKQVKEDYTDYSLSAVQPIFHPEAWRGVEVSKSKQKQSYYELQENSQTLGLDVAKAYFNVLKTQKNVVLASAQKEYYESKYKQIEEMLKFGLSNRIDLLETKVQQDKAASQWISEQKRLRVAKLKLEHLIGQSVDEIHPFDFTAIDTKKMAIERKNFESKIVYNPGMKAAEASEEAARHELASREYDHYPKVDFSLTRKQTNTLDSVAHQYDNQATLRMSIPLYQGGYTQSRVREGLLLLNSATKEREFYTKETKAHFEELWAERQYTVENFNLLKESEKSAELYLTSVEKGHKVGLKSLVDVLEAKTKLYEIRRDLVDAGYELINNELGLLDVCGELNVEMIQSFETTLQDE